MAALKIVVLSGDKQIILYGEHLYELFQVESYILERLEEQGCQTLARAGLRKFWIDDEGDRVDIINEKDFDFFIQQAGSKKPKIFFEVINQPTEQQSGDLRVHTTVECDICKTKPIVGFRYKCMQCVNYDLCMKCESEMKHSDHLMLRIPNSINQSNFEAFGVFNNKRRNRKHMTAGVTTEGLFSENKSRHHRSHRRQCTGAGLFSNLYDMMQDLAEGGAASEETVSAPQSQNQHEATAPPQRAASFEEARGAAARAASANVGLNVSRAANEAAMAAALAANDAAKSAAATASDAAKLAAANAVLAAMSKETNTSPDRNSTTTSAAQTATEQEVPVSPSLENLQNLIDPKFMKAGIQILNNFSEMFGKILDPAVIAETSRSSASRSSVDPIDLTNDRRASEASLLTTSGTSTTDLPKVSSQADSGKGTPMETEVSPQASIHAEDWTMIDTNEGSAKDAAGTSASQVPPFDFAKVSLILKTHVEEEKKKEEERKTTSTSNTHMSSTTEVSTASSVTVSAPADASTSTSTSVSTPHVIQTATSIPASESAEKRAIAVFHPDPRINSSVHAMMAMGFSNEGAVLTQLLESVNGSIPLALDLMSAAQRN